MPTIEQSLESKIDTSDLRRIHPDDLPTQTPFIQAAQNNSVANPFLRCPVPPVVKASVDDLQQYSRSGLIPQYRIWGPK